jgi:hypothetical protein
MGVGLASDALLHAAAEKLFQGAIADALTLVGQIAMLGALVQTSRAGERVSLEEGKIGGRL